MKYLLSLLALIGPYVEAQVGVRAEAQEYARAPSHVEFVVSPLVDLHFAVRNAATRLREGEDSNRFVAGESDLLDDALKACRQLEEALGDARFWGLLEGSMAGLERAEQLREAWGRLPITTRRREGGDLHLREPALAYAKALAAIEPAFLTAAWRERRTTLERARADLEHALPPLKRGEPAVVSAKSANLIQKMQRALGMVDPGVAIPVHLVIDAPAPGGFTHRTRRGAASFIAIRDRAPHLLEIVLHEALHAMDAATSEQNHAFNALRRRLAARDIAPTDPLMRDVPHTLFFVQAAETVRRHFDPMVPHYGDVTGYYSRVGDAAKAVCEIWIRHLDGELERDNALDAMLERIAITR